MTRLRSLLFAPANRPDLVPKLPRSHPDGVILDLEDAVPPEQKERARGLAVDAVADLNATAAGLPVWIRVNPPSDPLFDPDLEALGPGVAGILVPKLERAEQVGQVRDRLQGRRLFGLRLIGGLESAAGVAAAADIVVAGLDGVYFGAEDFVADVGGERTESNQEVLYARSRVALAAHVARRPALDQVVVDFRDLDRLRREAKEARALGYAGKLCIHPAQVPVVNEAFSPAPAEVERSRRLLAAHAAALAAHEGVFVFEGRMIDAPLVRQARDLLQRAGEEGAGGG
ncbi:MAG: CoA ester lyase [Candidatus Dormibacteraeota bacterium]|nr:CoA ester lyase [Candidatus Dormibacteraeota bacterium]